VKWTKKKVAGLVLVSSPPVVIFTWGILDHGWEFVVTVLAALVVVGLIVLGAVLVASDDGHE